MADEPENEKPMMLCEGDEQKSSASWMLAESTYIVETLARMVKEGHLTDPEVARMVATVVIGATLACMAPVGAIAVAAISADVMMAQLIDERKGGNAPTSTTLQ